MYNMLGSGNSWPDSEFQVGIGKCQAHLAALKKIPATKGMRMVSGWSCRGGGWGGEGRRPGG